MPDLMWVRVQSKKQNEQAKKLTLCHNLVLRVSTSTAQTRELMLKKQIPCVRDAHKIDWSGFYKPHIIQTFWHNQEKIQI